MCILDFLQGPHLQDYRLEIFRVRIVLQSRIKLAQRIIAVFPDVISGNKPRRPEPHFMIEREHPRCSLQLVEIELPGAARVMPFR